MTTAIVKIITEGHRVLFYTGRAGQDWLSESAADAFEYSPRGAIRKVEELQRMYARMGLRFDWQEKTTA